MKTSQLVEASMYSERHGYPSIGSLKRKRLSEGKKCRMSESTLCQGHRGSQPAKHESGISLLFLSVIKYS